MASVTFHSCSFSVLLHDATPCGLSSDYPGQVEVLALRNCARDISRHCELYGLKADTALDTEWKLLLARAGVFAVEDSHLSLTICPRHRAEFGIRRRSSKVKCSIPLEIAAHKTALVKGDRISVLCTFILNTEGILIQVGSPLCRICKQHFAVTNQQQKVTPAPMIEVAPCVELETSEANSSSNSSPGQSDTGQSVEEFAESLGRLTIADDTFLSPDTISTASTQSDEPTPVILPEPREKLSEFLLSWSDSSERTRQRQTRRATEIVANVLKSVTPDNAGELWRLLASSTAMNKALGVSELSHSEHLYLEALAEAYQNATSWDTRRQVLSIMAGVGTFNDISRYIPGLTRYRYSMANLHRSQFGRGAQVPQQPTTRIRVDLRQPDHFLGFITSPHLVQDLPFGQKHFKLTSGEVIQVPNVIRMMIPERVIQQYTQYCLETNFKPFSETTMRRVLSECGASVKIKKKKSLQGLDYFAAEGARPFDDLVALVRRIGELGSGKERETTVVQALMTSKQYLKGGYKVHVTSPSNVADHCVLFALSNSGDADYQQQYSHQHTDLCDRCQGL
ncbi:unnamed protein product [Pocillopora meandrina]|uniref:Uncharacterized protein n=1 Tax=Pocillopora meandrina TaxID=46732 RepID=A0AAU9Y6B3_9CNID|nr:unnamed protein product [Pocillopora meandrina]